MRCRLGVLFILMLCMLPKFGYAIEKVRVVVLPFEIHAREDLVYLENQVKEVIKNHLIREGALVVDSDITVASWKKKAETLDGIRSFGAEKGADYVIWGSLTRIGQKFSLDAKLIESFGDRRPTAFFQQGENIENLPGILKSLTDQVAVHLFKRERVAEVLVVGNNRIEEEAIKRVIQTKPGDIYLAKRNAAT